ncbi:YebC/PmpR family DNA-binding regulatory protein [Peptoniphilus olsenii]|uniref:Probable transcriptional regulatory protein ABID14_000185 n=1 Tax=Peptoniphilus olsenii TaxID=411570 RepID=A0ABV2J9H3_9FIRM
MAGHSKWNNIKNKKGKEDAKRGKIFTKLARQITVAAKEGGLDPEYNSSLKVAIDKAKAENMPNDNIERAIKKGSGSESSDAFEEVMYEGYGPNGVAVMVSCLTDNRNRTAPEIRHLFDKYNGNLGQPGCVSFMFDQKGVLGVLKDGIDEDEFTLEVIEYGAEDVKDMGEGFEIITSPEDYHQVRKSLEDDGYTFVESDITYLPQTTVDLTSEDDIKNMEKLIDALEDNDDVQDVYTSWERN